ncbi:sensor histidine kinase [Streptomyces yaizuensis]|uniref:histidine kinase n=1 Tax=Streptomyces yaizuensis TaxID=2989713 RepID=A0ABQ5NWQ7_9ACTN|nr:nitrate- and nitrite sensing domain-containing protein [Streptomyces sp. YSPA8]GLF94625.1 nitrate- and nitrite sensing domain-containing protein [Streptomyces sp. YSPA8]
MQKKRPQAPLAPETYPAQDGTAHGTAAAPVAKGRAKRVRNRLVIGVAVAGLAVAGAGTPGVLTGLDDLRESQRLLTLAQLNRQAVTLAHSLSDERDEVTAYIAAGRDEQRGGRGERRDVTDARTSRVDRQIEEIRGAIPDDRAELRRELATVPSLRRAALTGKGSAMEAHQAYTTVIGALQGLADELADRLPPRAPGATRAARATAELGLAAEQASAARGLLLGGLSVPAVEPVQTVDEITGLTVEEESEEGKRAEEARDALSAAAQQARVRELAALADFDQAAAKDARDSLAATVTGAEVKAAEGYLARLTDQPRLSEDDRRADREKLDAALTARIEQMRGVESTLASERIAALEALRDDDVTALEIQAAILAGLVLICVGVATATARTLTRPLAVVRIGAARLASAPDSGQPIAFTGRNDEFAQVVRSLNALHSRTRDLAQRADELSSERTGLIGSRDNLAAKLSEARAELRERTDELAAELQRLRHTVDHTFVNLSLRTLGLVERQLGVIEKLEEREQDPERLATLFKLDHMATVMRRHSENLLVLAGAEHGHGHPGPVPLVDVLRAAVSEIERYERVVIQALPPHAHIAGFAADDLSHLVAELLENATAFSPPDAQVELSGWLLENGEVMLSVTDTGIGMTAARLAELNARLDDPQAYELAPTGGDAEGLGLRVAGLLASRHKVRVQLREQKQGGVTAVVVLPAGLLPAPPPAEGLPGMSDTASTQVALVGSVAEANSNALPGGQRRPLPAHPGHAPQHAAPPLPRQDPLVAAAEAAVRQAGEPVHDTHERAADRAPVAAVDEPTFEMRAPEPDAPAVPEQALPGPGTPTPHVPAASAPAAHRTAAGHPPAAGPERAGEPAGPTASPPTTGAAPVWDRVTDKGLPKRTPKVVKPAAAPGERTGSVDAEALRRRLGGFQRAADRGRKEAEAEIARTGPREAGDTVEEARS